MHVELSVDSRIDLWQLLGSIDGPQRTELTKKYPSGKRLLNQQRRVQNSASEATGDSSDDHSHDPQITIESLRVGQNLASSKLPFLWKLHEMLEDVEKTGDCNIVSWLPGGKSFRVHRPKAFVKRIIPHYFKQSKYKSFQRQLHLYEFTRTPRGPEAGAYSHSKFIRGERSLCLSLSPIKIKGKSSKVKRNIKAQHQTDQMPSVAPQKTQSLDGGIDKPPASETQLLQLIAVAGKSNIAFTTGASLAAELAKKNDVDETGAHGGDVAYVFEGMPFRYMEDPNSSDSQPMDLDDVSEVSSEMDGFAL